PSRGTTFRARAGRRAATRWGFARRWRRWSRRGGGTRMKRWALGLAILLAVAAGGLWWAWNSLDFVVKAAIEHYGPRALGVPVAVREVRISTADGRGTIRGLEVGNPPGYSAPRALRAGTITAS